MTLPYIAVSFDLDMGERRPARDKAANPPHEPEELGFEEALGRLESLVGELEDGGLELESALAAFEQGVALARRCAGQLEEAEQRIDALVRDGEQWLARPFQDTDPDTDAAD